MIGGIDPGMVVEAQGLRFGSATAARGGSGAGERFESVLGNQILRGTVGKSRGSAEEQAHRAAESFVSLAFVQPILKQLRESSWAAEPFAPGAAEKQFGPLLDAEFSERITRAGNFPLVDRVAQDLLMQGERAGARAEGMVA